MTMGWEKTLFDDDTSRGESSYENNNDSSTIKKEVLPLDRLKNLEEKITAAVEKVKALKEEKNLLERKIRDFENLLNEKNREIETLRSEKSSIGNQLQELLSELETIEI
jgi:chromosome segregation ATPase